ncbi:hypothetical protein PYCH_19100 [Pyrococcus yayanosii CH1]|uniref:Uncharacterized protein n=2 Tax=Pyrococcus TaxID=2260 RepID=F8AIF6_PYRYC|nr:hypothetical protein PYCH_19100 [Pyrococcus yayanosii CH1]
MRIAAGLMVLLLLGSIVPLATADSTGDGRNICMKASHILEHLERVDVLTARVMGRINNSALLEEYRAAKELLKEAKNKYEAGECEVAVSTALKAMKHYRAVLKVVRKEGAPRISLKRIEDYLRKVDKFLDFAERAGIDVRKARETLNELRKVYGDMRAHAKERNWRALRKDIEKFRERQEKLERELREIRKQLLERKAERIVKAFLIKGGRAIELAKSLNDPNIVEPLEEFSKLYERVKELAEAGKYEEALKEIRENAAVIREFYRALREARG